MPLSRVIPSMFLRRLLLLLVLMSLPFGAIVAKMARLTLTQGDELRQRAEEKLVRWSWLPTVRGRILDRTGRVLAQDKPSYDIAVDYAVVSGEWAYTQAARFARRAHAPEWPRLAREEREERIERYLPAYRAHLDRAWEIFARTAGVERPELDRRRADVKNEVERLYTSIAGRQRLRQIEAQLARGQEITAEVQDEIEVRVDRDIREMNEPHVLAAKVSDETGLAFRRLHELSTEIRPGEGRGVETVRLVPLVPGLRVVSAGDREYPYDTMSVRLDRSTLPAPVRREGGDSVTLTVEGVATQVLGWMRSRIYREDTEGRAERLARDRALAERSLIRVENAREEQDRGAYQPGDAIGQSGVESGYEDTLRGLRGLATEQLDTGEERTVPPEPGRDVKLTLDIMLQARVQAIMDPRFGLAKVQDWHGADQATMPRGTELNGAAVVLDVDTGDILAMVSTPTFSRQRLRDDPDSVFKDAVDAPYLNRAIGVPYPPGSIVKAMILSGAVTRGNHRLESPIGCTGHLFPDKPNEFRCWIYKQHQSNHTEYLGHEPNGPEALMVSCNIYFFTLGRRLGPDGVVDVYRSFGVAGDHGWGLGAGPESVGILGPSDRSAPKGDPAKVRIHDAIQMGIGQGPVAWTPLHAADAYATLARHGVRITPRIRMDAPLETKDLHLDEHAVDAALEGLRLAVNDRHGTGTSMAYEANGKREKIVDVPGVEVRGKTGTATAPTIKVKPGEPLYNRAFDPAPPGEGEERLPPGVRVLRQGDHSWYVVLAGRSGSGPRYAISVVMEYAGSGGKVSGPIVNQIIRALIDEGYL
jgi:penicillin-binding protein 2